MKNEITQPFRDVWFRYRSLFNEFFSPGGEEEEEEEDPEKKEKMEVLDRFFSSDDPLNPDNFEYITKGKRKGMGSVSRELTLDEAENNKLGLEYKDLSDELEVPETVDKVTETEEEASEGPGDQEVPSDSDTQEASDTDEAPEVSEEELDVSDIDAMTDEEIDAMLVKVKPREAGMLEKKTKNRGF